MYDDDLYYETIKKILDRAIPSYSQREGIPIDAIDAEIAKHIKETSAEHFSPDPDIDYNNPLCRLGYLFANAGANACLFERTIKSSTVLSERIDAHSNQSLSICTIGGGPGTEILGLTKYTLSVKKTPTDITFKVLDNINQWGESWEMLARISQDLLRRASSCFRGIDKAFYSMDATNPQNYLDYAWLFEDVDIVVLSYFLSENKVRLNDFKNVLEILIRKVKDDCLFVVIDRRENNPLFRGDVIRLFTYSELSILQKGEIGEGMDVHADYRAIGEYLQRLNRKPRRWFRTLQEKTPTVFWLVAQKPLEDDSPF